MPVLPLLAAALAVAAVTGATVPSASVAAPRHLSVAQPPARYVPVGGTVSVAVPTVATSLHDGLPRVLPAGGHQLDLPVWEAVGGPSARVDGQVSGAPGHCRGVPLAPGAVVRLRCAFAVQPGTRRVVVTLRAGGDVVGRFVHVSAG